MLTKKMLLKKITGKEARRVATAVASAEFAGELRRLRRAVRRSIIQAGSHIKRELPDVRLTRCRMALGLVVPARFVWSGMEGLQLSDRVGRWYVITPTDQGAIYLPDWSFGNWSLTRLGVQIVDRFCDNAFSRNATALHSALVARSQRWTAVYTSLPASATVGDAVRLYSEDIVTGCLDHGIF